jgi:hypothetical protein
MNNMIIYTIFSLSNILIILKINDLLIKNFLQVYTLTTLISSILLIIYLSTKRKGIKKILIFVSLWIATLLILNNNILLWIIYSISLVLFDYLSTFQNNKASKFLRILFSLIPFFFYFNIFSLDQLIILRIVIFFVFLLFVLSDNNKNKLNIKKPFRYIIQTHIGYYGGLYILTLLLTSNLKLFYLTQQITLSIILKIMDIKLRNIKFFKFIKNRYYWSISVTVLALTIIFFLKLNFILGCVIYLVSFLLITNSYKLIKK